MAEINEKSEYIRASLEGQDGVASVTGLGLMLGIEVTKRSASEIINSLIERGVLVLSAKNKIRLLPPLNIPFETLEKAIKIIKEELAK